MSKPMDRAVNSTEELLIERGKTHGDFANHAGCTQDLKACVNHWAQKSNKEKAPTGYFDAVVSEALDMICHKIGRIVAGDPMFKDHWDDIAGYARLVSERIK